MLTKLRIALLGRPLDPLAAFLAWARIDAVETLSGMCRDLSRAYPQALFFTSRLVFRRENLLVRLLHNQAALAIQRRLHFDGLQMIILPMKV